MGQVIVDNIDLLEPNLRIPGKRPVGQVKSEKVIGWWTAQNGFMSGFNPPMVAVDTQDIIQTRWGQAIEDKSSTSTLTDNNIRGKAYAIVIDFELTINDLISTSAEIEFLSFSFTGTPNTIKLGATTGYLTDEIIAIYGTLNRRSGVSGTIAQGKHVLVIYYEPNSPTHTYRFILDGAMLTTISNDGGAELINIIDGLRLFGYRYSTTSRVRWMGVQVIGAQISRQQAISLSLDPYQFLIPSLGAGLRFIGAKSLAGPTLFMSAYGA